MKVLTIVKDIVIPALVASIAIGAWLYICMVVALQ